MPIALKPRGVFEYILKRERPSPDPDPDPDEDQDEESPGVEAREPDDLSADLPEDPTVFLLMEPSPMERARIEDRSMGAADGEMYIKAGTQRLELLYVGLKGWRNFPDGEGGFAEFEETSGKKGRRVRVTDACLDLLSSDDQQELAEAIAEGNRVSAQEGNS